MTDVPSVKVGINVDLGNTIAELKKSGTKFKENRTYGKEVYNDLLGKYAAALSVIDVLQAQLAEAERSKMPSAEEIEGMTSVLGMLDTLTTSMPKLAKLQNQMNKINRVGAH